MLPILKNMFHASKKHVGQGLALEQPVGLTIGPSSMSDFSQIGGQGLAPSLPLGATIGKKMSRL